MTALVEPGTPVFGWYGLGLAVGFAGYAALYRLAAGRTEFARTMGRDDRPDTAPRGGGGPV